jgi:hypothetical protein
MMEALKHLEELVSAKKSVIKNAYALFSLEAKLAELSAFPLVVNICMLFVVLLTLWFTAMFVLGYFLLLANYGLLLSIGLILLINIGLLLALLKYLFFNLKSMSFQKTREFFSKNKREEHEKLKEPSNSTNCKSKQRITRTKK